MSDDASARLGFEPLVSNFDYIIEHLDDAEKWSQLGRTMQSEDEARDFMRMWRCQNPTQKFRIVERITHTRIVDA